MSTLTAKEQELESHIQSMGAMRQEEDARQRAATLGLSYSDGTTLPLDSGAMKTLPQEACVRAQLLVTFKEGAGVVVATVNPEIPEVKELLGQLKETFSAIRIFVVSAATFTSLVAQYPSQTDAPIATSGVIAIADVSTNNALHAIGDLAGSLKGLTASDAMGRLLTGALALKGSDIHLEPEASSTRIRIRVDGFLHDAGTLESSQASHIVDRIKILSGTKLNITKAPQDGRFTIQQPSLAMEVRVSLLPSEYGESVVMRLLDPRSILVTLDNQGMPARVLELVLKTLAQPQGSVIATGPTGSGKTTTLYACVQHLNTPDTKIITIEDPIEYHLSGINQTQIDASAGYTFAQGLRSIVRQDPDVILVGEIRDHETAEITMNAALTGHLVLSTIHTNDAASTVARLKDLEVTSPTLASALSVVLSKRLVRKLCTECRRLVTPTPAELQEITSQFEGLADVPEQAAWSVYEAVGCQACNNLGYKGRTGVYECLPFSRAVQEAVSAGATTLQIQDIAKTEGMESILQDGYRKVIQGITSLAEVHRVLG